MEARIKWLDRKGDIHVSLVNADNINDVLEIFGLVEPTGIIETVEEMIGDGEDESE
jgi:hypothetical protein